MTQWDQTFLKSLYLTDPKSKLQRSQIAPRDGARYHSLTMTRPSLILGLATLLTALAGSTGRCCR